MVIMKTALRRGATYARFPSFRPLRFKSTLGATSSEGHHHGDAKKHHHGSLSNPVPDFGDARAAYEPKSTAELLRAATCFQLCRSRWLVQNAETLLTTTRKIAPPIVDAILKGTFYGHFCAGEDQERIRPTIEALDKNGIGSILDYAAEDDSGDESNNDTVVAKTYDYESEAQCDRHVATFLHCIRDVAASTKEGSDGYAAIKVTALGNPKLLARLSTAITEAKRLFEVFDVNQDGIISREEFEIGYRRFFVDGDDKIKTILEEFDPDDNGKIDYITWSLMLDPKDLPAMVKSCRMPGRLADACPTDEEIELLTAMFDRGRKLGEEAAKTGTRLLVDAEQVRYQPAIDNLVLELQRTFNAIDVAKRPVIYNTYQAYLKDSPERLRTDVARSERFNYHFGAKLVRGAYMESERRWAEDLGLPDPIHDSLEDTHSCYDESVDYLLRRSTETENHLEFMCATHNQTSIEKAIDAMNRLGIDRKDSTICFAQLLGMSDHLSYNLGKTGYRVFKYVPYGEVHEVMPYLLRRARENSAIVGGAMLELEMIKQELRRRLRA